MHNKGKPKLESNDEWYKTVANRPADWDGIECNIRKECPREHWGGANELALWAYITNTIVVVTNKNTDTCMVYEPN